MFSISVAMLKKNKIKLNYEPNYYYLKLQSNRVCPIRPFLGNVKKDI